MESLVRTREPVRENDLCAPIAIGVLVRKRRVRRVRTHTAPNGQVARQETARPPVSAGSVRRLLVFAGSSSSSDTDDHVVRGFDAGTARSSSRGYAARREVRRAPTHAACHAYFATRGNFTRTRGRRKDGVPRSVIVTYRRMRDLTFRCLECGGEACPPWTTYCPLCAAERDAILSVDDAGSRASSMDEG